MVGGGRVWPRFSGGGGRCGAASCGPVSLACVCCGALGHVVVSNIGEHLVFGGILAGCQRGFRGRGSCGARLVRFFHGLVGGLGRALGRGRGRTGVVVVDFAGAFGGVPSGGAVVQIELLRDGGVCSRVGRFVALWALSGGGVGWPGLGSGPGPVWCPPGVGLGAGPVSHFYQWSSRGCRVVCSPFCWRLCLV